jgi:hypothetical protein
LDLRKSLGTAKIFLKSNLFFHFGKSETSLNRKNFLKLNVLKSKNYCITCLIVQYLVVYLLDIVGQDIDIPANILNIYYVFSFIDPKTCRLFWLSKKHRGWIQKLKHIGPQYSIPHGRHCSPRFLYFLLAFEVHLALCMVSIQERFLIKSNL